jgi:hypothetical protein
MPKCPTQERTSNQIDNQAIELVIKEADIGTTFPRPPKTVAYTNRGLFWL